MKELAVKLQSLIEDYRMQLLLSVNKANESRGEGKWKRSEELGHLIDSAQNNIRRFIVGQYEASPHIIYYQKEWVAASDYSSWSFESIIALWYLLNLQIAKIWMTMPSELYGRMCNTGRSEVELRSLEWLAADYIVHMQHHLHHILDIDRVLYS